MHPGTSVLRALGALGLGAALLLAAGGGARAASAGPPAPALAPAAAVVRATPSREPPPCCSLLPTAVVGGAAAGFAAGGDPSTVEAVGDVLERALPALALTDALLTGDLRTVGRSAVVLGGTWGVVYGLKQVISKQRPSGLDDGSFPSGHTAITFASAALIYNRHGPVWGLPAYAAAAFTGASRLIADRHYLDDVVAGAGIGWMIAQLVTGPRGGPSTASAWRWRVDLEVGWYRGLEHDLERGGSGELELDAWGALNAQDVFASLQITHRPRRARRLWARVDPLEQSADVRAPGDVRFGGLTIPAGQPFHVRWRTQRLTLGWSADLLRARRITLAAGVTLALQDRYVEVVRGGGLGRVSADDVELLPQAYGALRWQLARHLLLQAELQAVAWPDLADLTAQACLHWDLGGGWDVGAGLRLCAGQRRGGDTLEGEWVERSLVLSVGRAL